MHLQFGGLVHRNQHRGTHRFKSRGPHIWRTWRPKCRSLFSPVRYHSNLFSSSALNSAATYSFILWCRLFDYPESARSQILDYLFKPHFGANLWVCKVEVSLLIDCFLQLVRTFVFPVLFRLVVTPNRLTGLSLATCTTAMTWIAREDTNSGGKLSICIASVPFCITKRTYTRKHYFMQAHERS